jgi:hypothetical protein
MVETGYHALRHVAYARVIIDDQEAVSFAVAHS